MGRKAKAAATPEKQPAVAMTRRSTRRGRNRSDSESEEPAAPIAMPNYREDSDSGSERDVHDDDFSPKKTPTRGGRRGRGNSRSAAASSGSDREAARTPKPRGGGRGRRGAGHSASPVTKDLSAVIEIADNENGDEEVLPAPEVKQQSPAPIAKEASPEQVVKEPTPEPVVAREKTPEAKKRPAPPPAQDDESSSSSSSNSSSSSPSEEDDEESNSRTSTPDNPIQQSSKQARPMAPKEKTTPPLIVETPPAAIVEAVAPVCEITEDVQMKEDESASPKEEESLPVGVEAKAIKPADQDVEKLGTEKAVEKNQEEEEAKKEEEVVEGSEGKEVDEGLKEEEEEESKVKGKLEHEANEPLQPPSENRSHRGDDHATTTDKAPAADQLSPPSSRSSSSRPQPHHRRPATAMDGAGDQEPPTPAAPEDPKATAPEDQQNPAAAPPPARKRRWTSRKDTEAPKVIAITTDSLKGIIEDVRPVALSDVKMESSPEPEERPPALSLTSRSKQRRMVADDEPPAKRMLGKEERGEKSVEVGDDDEETREEGEVAEEEGEGGAAEKDAAANGKSTLAEDDEASKGSSSTGSEGPRKRDLKDLKAVKRTVENAPEPTAARMERKVSIVEEKGDREATKATSGGGPGGTGAQKNPTSCVLYITNLVRPFTLLQLKGLLARTGKIVENGFWIDKIKSKCYVQYETEDEAVETRHALHGVRWPVSNPKVLHVDFSSEQMMQRVIEATAGDGLGGGAGKVIDLGNRDKGIGDRAAEERRREPIRAAVREWDVGKREPVDEEKGKGAAAGGRDPREGSRDRQREANDPERKRSVSPDRRTKYKKESEPPRLLDDLFRKTKTTPCIYWLPLTPEQIAIKQEARRKQIEEHKQRQEEMQRQEKEREEERLKREKERREKDRNRSNDRDKERSRNRSRDRHRSRSTERRRERSRSKDDRRRQR